jgi:1,6-anhydro-N-acetylmuramate kinase
VRAETANVPALEAAETRAHGGAIERFLREHAIAANALDLIGLHGQTVFHAPQQRINRQLGSGAEIATRFGVPTVFRFRHADIAAGGEGAPWVPLYHQALAANLQKPLMILNLGGIGNVTLSDADAAATLAEFTVQATVAALHHVKGAPLRWLVTGGGRHNAHFMQRFAAELRVPVEPVEAVGWNGDFLEAQCFGYLAVRSLLRLPLSLPSTTGVPQPMTGGEMAEP